MSISHIAVSGYGTNLPLCFLLCILGIVVSMHQCNLSSTLASPHPLSFLDAVCLYHIRDVRPIHHHKFSCSLVLLFKFFPRPL